MVALRAPFLLNFITNTHQRSRASHAHTGVI